MCRCIRIRYACVCNCVKVYKAVRNVCVCRWFIISWYVCVCDSDYREFKKKTLQSMSELGVTVTIYVTSHC